MTLPRSRRILSPVLAVGLATATLALAGCSNLSAQTTTNVTYAPSDGVQGDIGDLAIRNLLLVSAERGAPAQLIGSLVNSTGDDLEVAIDVEQGSASETVDVPANEVVVLGPEADAQVSVDALDLHPGQSASVSVIGGEGNLNLRVPIVDGALPEYADLVDDA